MPQDAGIGREYVQLDVSKLNPKEVKDLQSFVRTMIGLTENSNRAYRQIWDRLDALEGRRGLVQLGSDIDLNGHLVVNSADAEDAGDLVSKSYAEANYGPIAMAEALSLAGTNPLNVSGLRGQLFQAQPAAAPQGSVDVILDTALDGTLFVQNNILYRVDASQSPAVAVPVSGIGVVIAVDHATRVADYDPDDYAIGTLLYETDRHYLYSVEDNTGNVWQYMAGVYTAAVASRPADLGADDDGAFFYATDATEKVLYLWTGAAWETSGVSSGAALTANAIVLGAGNRLITVLGSLGTATTVLHGNAGGAPSFGAVSLTADVTGTLGVANGGTAVTYDRIAASLAFLLQTATLGPTTIASAGTQFLFSYTLLITTTDAGAATVQVSINYTDEIGATSQAGAALAVTANNRDRGTFVIERLSGNLTYTVTVTGAIGTAVYSFHATLQRLS